MRILMLFIIILSFNYNCDEKNPTKPQNQYPIITSLQVFPAWMQPSDSFIVICEAYDPDGDTLVYDWITPGPIVKIKGTDDSRLYHTSENSHIFYAPESKFLYTDPDTFFIKCGVRDVKGGGDMDIIYFYVTMTNNTKNFSQSLY